MKKSTSFLGAATFWTTSQGRFLPAKVLIVQADEDKKEAKVIVPDEKLSLAIGKEGQNARLAARLTGWKIDVKSYTAAMQSGMFDDIHENEEG